MSVGRNHGTGQLSRFARLVVEYDLPADYRRKRFYRAVRRYLREHCLEEAGWSTMSVILTEDTDFAWFVYRQARKAGGTAHVYEARRLDDEP